MKKVLVLFGGNSFEHYISCLSAKTILENIDRKKYDVTAAYINKDNQWFIFNDDLDTLTKEINKDKLQKVTNILDFLKSFDKVFPIMHGSPVENGSLQGMLDLFDIKYVGTGLLGSIIGYDKELTKIICEKHGIPQVPYITITENKPLKNITIDFPVIVKPAKCGSSIGINIANNLKELNKYVKEAFKYDNKVIVEKYIVSRELECAVLDNKELIVAPVGEIKSAHTFYDYEAKYFSNSLTIIPAPLDEKITKEIQNLSLKIFKALELKGLSRIDFLYDYKNDKLYFNEVNTMPGFTKISMYPMLFNELGIPIKELITILIEN